MRANPSVTLPPGVTIEACDWTAWTSRSWLTSSATPLKEVLDRLRDEPLVLGTRSAIVLGRLLEHTKGGPLGPPLVTTDQPSPETG